MIKDTAIDLSTVQPADITITEPTTPARTNANRLASSRQRAYGADLLKAHVTLMEREVILPRQPELFRLVQRHYYTLQTWHDQHTGWRIQRSPTVIRLLRHPNAATPGYLYDRLKDPGDFACLTWILWYAENRQLSGRGIDQQFLLSQLAEQIQEQAGANEEGEARLDFRRPSDRYGILRALAYLEDLGGIQLIDGQTREWVEQTAGADVLYEFTDVTRSLVAALNPQLVAAMTAHLSDSTSAIQPTLLPGAETTPGVVRAWRSLLLGPALFRYDDPVAFDTVLAEADEIANELLETFGWLLEVNRDYACIVRASGMSSGPITSLLSFATNDQIALLLCSAIREQVASSVWPQPDAYGCLHVNAEDMAALFYSVREAHGENWGSEARNKSARSLLNDVYKKMRLVGLLRGPDAAGNILILPTAARYAASYDKNGQEADRSRTKSNGKAKPAPGKNGKSSQNESLWSTKSAGNV